MRARAPMCTTDGQEVVMHHSDYTLTSTPYPGVSAGNTSLTHTHHPLVVCASSTCVHCMSMSTYII